MVPHRSRLHYSVDRALRRQHLPLGTRGAGHEPASYRADQAWLISVLLTTGAVVDIVIAATMLQYLMKKREKGLQR